MEQRMGTNSDEKMEQMMDHLLGNKRVQMSAPWKA
jgi:hypothetical protein